MSFGIIIVCSNKDFSLAKGCLASVKYFMPDVDTCLLIDGDVDTTSIEKEYKSIIIKRNNIQNKFLKENSFGWGITKMNAFWESPFDEFLLLDADICVWGNILKEMETGQYDMIIDQPQYSFNREAVDKWFFDTDKLFGIDSRFIPEEYCERYFCTGVFYSKKGVFDLAWYQDLFMKSKLQPDLFKFGEMGMLNYMIFKSVKDKKLKVLNKHIQHICPDFERSYSAELFPFKNGLPSIIKPMVIHYNGNRKPYMKNKLSYHEPMTFFRKQYYQKVKPGLSDSEIMNILRFEDKHFEPKVTLKQRVKNLIRPFVKPLLR